MPIDNTKKSSRLLQSRRYTHDSFTDAQEAFTSVLDINASEIYLDQGLIPTSSLPFSASGQHLQTYSVNGQAVLKYYYRQKLTKSDLNNEVWFFTVPTGSVGGIGAQLIDTNQQTNFISPKYSIPSLANANAEDTPPGYLAKVFVSTNATTPANGDVISANNYSFDYKTGVLQFSSSAVSPTAGQYVYITSYQYVGRSLDNITTSTGVVTASYALTASYVSGAASDWNSLANKPAGLVSSSEQINTGSFSGSFIGTATTASYVVPSGLPAGLVSSSAQAVSWSVATASFAITSSYVVPSGLPTGLISSSTQLPPGSVSSSAQIEHDLTSGYSSSRHIDHDTVDVLAGSGLIGGGTITSSLTVSLDTSSAHFIDGVISALPPGVVSSSSQLTTFSGSFTGSFSGSGALLTDIPSASYAETSSFAVSSISSSYALTASYALNGSGGGSSISSSWASQSISSSYALTASHALNAKFTTLDSYYFIGNGSTSAYVLSQSYDASSLFVSVNGLTYISPNDYTLVGPALTFTTTPVSESNIVIRGLVNTATNASGTFAGTFAGTASFALTASYALNATGGGSSVSSSWASQSISSSYAQTSSFAVTASYLLGGSPAFIFDGGTPSSSFAAGPIFDCGGVT